MQNTPSPSYSSNCPWDLTFEPMDRTCPNADQELLEQLAATSGQYCNSHDLPYTSPPTSISTSLALSLPTPLQADHYMFPANGSELINPHTNAPSSTHLSVDVHQPFISITEPTPIKRTSTTNLLFVDQFIAHHAAELKQDRIAPQSVVPDWVSWTPTYGLSPTLSNDMMQLEISSAYSLSPEAQLLDLFPDLNDSPEPQYMAPAPSAPVPIPAAQSYPQAQQLLAPETKRTNRGRPRRVSEPPKASTLDLRVLSPTRGMRRSSSDRRGESNYPCQHPGCGKSFTRPYNLTSHMRTHTSERPYPCVNCGRRFARQHDRNRHEKLHWGIKPHACTHCNKQFARMDALNRHLRVEKGCSNTGHSSEELCNDTIHECTGDAFG